MSADYNFWKYKQNVVHEDEKVYASLCDGEQLEELQSLPIEKISSDNSGVRKDSPLKPLRFSSRGPFSITIAAYFCVLA